MRYLVAILVTIILSTPAIGQEAVTFEDYERAEGFLGNYTRSLVFNASVTPNWLDDGRMWYRNTTAEGVEFVLVDQDEHTMHYCHEALSRAVVQRGQDPHPMAELNCINISIKQILQPGSDAESRFISGALKGADFIYATGLFDYLPHPIALRLLRKLYALLAPGGSVFIGNLRHCPVSTWIMEYVLAWHLQYRTEETMLSLSTGLSPAPTIQRTVTDKTGLCVFLEVRKPSALPTG